MNRTDKVKFNSEIISADKLKGSMIEMIGYCEEETNMPATFDNRNYQVMISDHMGNDRRIKLKELMNKF
jgi:hypothetical protein